MRQNLVLLNARSAKPPLTVKQAAEGYLLNENAQPKTNSSSFLGWVVAIFFFLIFSWFFLLIGLFFLITIPFYQPFRQSIRVSFSLLPGELIFPYYPLQVDSEALVIFRRKLKGDRKISQNASVRIKLLCVERVSYTKGTDTIVETAVIEEKILKSQSIMSGVNEITCDFNLKIPTHLPSSFESKMNQIRWVVVVEQNLPSIVENIDSNFTFFVEL